ncbi:MAG TPA: YitT family protein [Haploplasma sp.]|nr:YitT family protein [Haploplasma sp.]
MKKVKEFIASPKYKESVKPEFKRVLAVIFFTFIYGLGVQWFLEASAVPLFTGGIPGVAQVLRDIFFRGANQAEAGRMFMSIFIIVSNVPILILGWFGVSKKFTIYSLISVIIQSAVIGFIPDFELGLGGVEHALLASILGGLLIGVGIGGALKYGTSTGGFDIIAQYWSLKHGHSVGFISMALNIAIAVAGALVSKNPNVAAGVIFSYTVIRIIITTVATDKVHTSYQFLAIDIITENPKEMIDSILHQLGRGVTLSKVQGAYSTHEKTQIMCVISTYELQQMTAIINHVDDKAFVIAKPVKSVIGNFTKKRIA